MARADYEKLMAKIDHKNAELAQRMPDEFAALEAALDAHIRLRQLGFSDIIYCPKDGRLFDCVSAGSTGIHTCHYEGDWPNGSWWIHEAGDLWPAYPTMFRLKK